MTGKRLVEHERRVPTLATGGCAPIMATLPFAANGSDDIRENTRVRGPANALRRRPCEKKPMPYGQPTPHGEILSP